MAAQAGPLVCRACSSIQAAHLLKVEGALAAQAPQKVQGPLTKLARSQLPKAAHALLNVEGAVAAQELQCNHREIRHVDTRPLDSVIPRAYKRGCPKS